MSAQDRLELVSVKVDRAKEHLSMLAADVRTYLASKPYDVATKRVSDSRRLVYFVASVRPTPHRLSAILGDAIHNLRSALDHLAYQLVWVGSGKRPSSHVYFPIADDRTKYIEQRRRQMKGATPAAIATLDSLAPYKGGNDDLWRLHRLDNVDKHRVLLTSGSALRSINLGALMLEQALRHFVPPPEADKLLETHRLDLFFRPADRMFPIKVGDELLVDAPDAETSEKLEFRFEVAFGEEGVALGEPILETLSTLLQAVEAIPPKFESHLG